ncbi:MAG: ABC transporter permease [Planctomycetota bacterium]|nr:MAG: ABC transporter permease [Planctomycetota bacterium]REK27427.1 MAG: ABC transporter permease [Planctomycetota bacterium]
MYKLLLSGRYLRTRFIALASIVSVMLGVATMIVVNSVMAGFSGEMKVRLHGILADMMVESVSSDGFDDSESVIQAINQVAGDHIEAITPVIEVYGMMSFDWPGGTITQPVTLVGIDPQGKDMVSAIRQYMMSRQEIREDGRLVRAPLRQLDAPFDWELTDEAMQHRREWLQWERIRARAEQHQGAVMYPEPSVEGESLGGGDPFANATNPFDDDPLAVDDEQPDEQIADTRDPDAPLSARVFIGVGLISYPYVESETGKTRTMMMLEPGEDVRFTTVTTGTPDAARFAATVADVFKSGMSEYDSTLVFCNLEELQLARKMLSPLDEKDWRNGSVTSLQIKLKDYDDAGIVAQKLLASLPAGEFQVRTWEQKQGPLLQAVEVEAAILNVLLFLIIAVAGFGILAIFYMIVVEKTRDIGILKALGASSGGVMSIFLAYGLGLGVVGSGVGVGLGLLFVKYINEIEDGVSWLTGRKVFDETIYYFHEIPTSVHPAMVVWVAIGAMAIAVLASVLPARRASQLDPVQALRYE